MEFKDYYRILGIEPDADAKSIKSAYRQLARKYHPDLNPDAGAEAKFKEVAEAYEVLKDPQRRAEFDELRKYGSKGAQGFEPPPGWQGSSGFEYRAAGDEADFSEFFNNLFGHRGRGFEGFGEGAPPNRRGQDVEIELPVFLEETIAVNEKSIEYELPAYGQSPPISKQLKVKIPQGVLDGERIRLKGQGRPGRNGGEAGDLYLHIRVVPHPLFDVQGHDLIITLPLAPWEAVLGTKVRVPTLGGPIQLTIPANTPAGKKLRIKGKGLKGRKGSGVEGDLYAVIKLVLPPHSSEQQKRLWQELAASDPFDPRAEWRL
ncbi:DnaJ C-terminal domain-containing protein [Aestuariirhabdus litorea]|uniref:DNA-binding protein n=1 Tax=Aestuariirhabdus litorea TaxID=2528527 RepID=A0A3P3VLW6_9GAMM|nr:DnaJ C-terminal domain-containing protein [Aestuariirhabdus litorea]RRJ83327.1 DNA-binding protein [Aestuariirhabdus litorea]RWW93487.1 DNA-binding protein [Endozoicomonadaceae bacterium GTF-13]